MKEDDGHRASANRYHRAMTAADPIDRVESANGETTVRYIVCGDTSLTHRLVTELLALPDAEVTVLTRTPDHDDLPARSGLTVRAMTRIDRHALAAVGVGTANAIAFTDQDDVANLDAALLTRELAPDVRIVVRMFDDVLAASVGDLVANCTVLSATAVAAPAFVAAAIDRDAPTPLRLFNRSVYVTDRDRSQPGDVICGLADTSGHGEPIVLPADRTARIWC